MTKFRPRNFNSRWITGGETWYTIRRKTAVLFVGPC